MTVNIFLFFLYTFQNRQGYISTVKLQLAKLEQINLSESAVDALLAGEVDGVVVDKVPGQDIMEKCWKHVRKYNLSMYSMIVTCESLLTFPLPPWMGRRGRCCGRPGQSAGPCRGTRPSPPWCRAVTL